MFIVDDVVYFLNDEIFMTSFIFSLQPIQITVNKKFPFVRQSQLPCQLAPLKKPLKMDIAQTLILVPAERRSFPYNITAIRRIPVRRTPL